MELKVGDYVRIVDNLGKQFIGKIYNINDFREPSMKYAVDCQIFNDYAFVGEEIILKSSPSIIDLIRVGDYVNGYKVIHIGFDDDKKTLLFIDWQEDAHHRGGNAIKDNDIKSIVTKEQFEQMKYKIGGEE